MTFFWKNKQKFIFSQLSFDSDGICGSGEEAREVGRRLADENSHAGKAPAADSVAENKK